MNRKFCTALGLAILLSTASNAQAIELKKGVGSSWFLNVHNWTGALGTAAKPGKRLFEDIEEKI